MTRYAHIVDGRAFNFDELPDDASPADLYPEDFATSMAECGPEVEQGWLYDGSAFTAPPSEPEPPAPTRQATYERLYSAMDALGVRSAWDAAFAAAKPIYQAYFAGHYVDPIPEDSSKLAKVAAAAKPAINVKAVFDQVDALTS